MISGPRLAGRLVSVALVAASFFPAACQVVPPTEHVRAETGNVRAETRLLAERVAHDLDRLAPAVLHAVPGSRAQHLDVWVQSKPALYRFGSASYDDADGFYARGPRRIHLRSTADDLERTLAHELVHAQIGPEWRTLPGTLEEGLCDAVSAILCPQGAARLSAGRLSSAAFALGGLELSLDLELPAEMHPAGVALRMLARLRLEGDPELRVDPLEVLHEEAGLSSSSLPANHKKALYGLAFLMCQRIIAARGIEGLHELCRKTAEDERRFVSTNALLEAAGLDRQSASWRHAAEQAFGPAELTELVRLHPDFLAEALADFFAPELAHEDLATALPWLKAELGVPASGAKIDLLEVPEVRVALAEAWEGRAPRRTAAVANPRKNGQACASTSAP